MAKFCGEDGKIPQDVVWGRQAAFPDGYAIPLWSANLMPEYVMKAQEVAKALRTSPAKTSFASEFEKFFKTVNDEHTAVAKHWANFFGVPRKVDAKEVCKPGTKECTIKKAMQILPGLALGLTDSYARKLQKWEKRTAEEMKKLDDQLAKEGAVHAAIGWEVGFHVAATLGSSTVGFCTPDTNAVQAVFPEISSKGEFSGPMGTASTGRESSIGFSLYFQILGSLGLGVTVKRDNFGTWTVEAMMRIYIMQHTTELYKKEDKTEETSETEEKPPPSDFAKWMGGESDVVGQKAAFHEESHSVINSIENKFLRGMSIKIIVAVVSTMLEAYSSYQADKESFSAKKFMLQQLGEWIEKMAKLLLACLVDQFTKNIFDFLNKNGVVNWYNYVILEVNTAKSSNNNNLEISMSLQTLSVIEFSFGGDALEGIFTFKPTLSDGHVFDLGLLLNHFMNFALNLYDGRGSETKYIAKMTDEKDVSVLRSRRCNICVSLVGQLLWQKQNIKQNFKPFCESTYLKGKVKDPTADHKLCLSLARDLEILHGTSYGGGASNTEEEFKKMFMIGANKAVGEEGSFLNELQTTCTRKLVGDGTCRDCRHYTDPMCIDCIGEEYCYWNMVACLGRMEAPPDDDE